DDAGGDAGEQQRKVPDAERQAHHERRVRELEDVPAQDDLLAHHTDRVKEGAKAEAAKAVMSRELDQRPGREAHCAHPIAVETPGERRRWRVGVSGPRGARSHTAFGWAPSGRCSVRCPWRERVPIPPPATST